MHRSACGAHSLVIANADPTADHALHSPVLQNRAQQILTAEQEGMERRSPGRRRHRDLRSVPGCEARAETGRTAMQRNGDRSRERAPGEHGRPAAYALKHVACVFVCSSPPSLPYLSPHFSAMLLQVPGGGDILCRSAVRFVRGHKVVVTPSRVAQWGGRIDRLGKTQA